MSSKLRKALADQTELFTDTQHISHPYTQQHVNELRRRSVRIGAGLSGEERTRYNAVQEVGLRAVAKVVARNQVDVMHDNAMVGVAGVEVGNPRWLDKLESLEYAVSSFGLVCERNGDSTVTVKPIKLSCDTVTVEACAARTGKHVKVTLSGSTLRQAKAVTEKTYLSDALNTDSDLKTFSKDDFQLLLGLCDEHTGTSKLKTALLEAVGIK